MFDMSVRITAHPSQAVCDAAVRACGIVSVQDTVFKKF